MLRDIYWNPKNIGIVKCFLTQISDHNTVEFLVWNCLFVLYFWSCYCRCWLNVIDEMSPILQELSKVYTRRTKEEAVCLALLFFYVTPRHTNIMIKCSIFLMNLLPHVYICPLRKKSLHIQIFFLLSYELKIFFQIFVSKLYRVSCFEE